MSGNIPVTSSISLTWLQIQMHTHGHTIIYPNSEFGPNKTFLDAHFEFLEEHCFSADLPNFKTFLINHILHHISKTTYGPLFGIFNESAIIRINDTFIQHAFHMFRTQNNPTFLCDDIFNAM
jgi:hypothetical protein